MVEEKEDDAVRDKRPFLGFYYGYGKDE